MHKIFKDEVASMALGGTRNFDLHSHSTASDGTLSPAELVQLAQRQGVDVLALTDHDTTAGLEEAAGAARDVGLSLIAGIEISVTWEAQSVHVIGLRLDPANPALQQGLAQLAARRDGRAQEIAQRLEHQGIIGALEGAAAHAGRASITRTHFARFLLEAGYVHTLSEAFRCFLGRDAPCHVPGEWASLEQAMEWITGAGGQAVIAHPARYKLKRRRFYRLLSEFRDCGGSGLEVMSGSHSQEECLLMAHHARAFGLLASQGSDYHGPPYGGIGLGQLPPLPDGCIPIWATWNSV